MQAPPNNSPDSGGPRSSRFRGSMRERAGQLFRDNDGNPKMIDSVVVFMDALGTSAASTSPDAAEHLIALHKAITHAATQSAIDHPGLLQYTTWFTDNVVAALPIALHQDPESAAVHAATTAAELSVAMLEHGVASRGGVSLGAIYVDDRFAFGPGLISAHDLEAVAGQPRILIDDRVANLLRRSVEASVLERNDSPGPNSPFLDDGHLCINQFDIAFSGRDRERRQDIATTLDARIRQGFARASENPRAQSKWAWARRLFDDAVARYSVDISRDGGPTYT